MSGYKPKLTYDYVYNYFKDQNCELLEKEYINAFAKMKYKCKCGDIAQISWGAFRNNQRCKKCGLKEIAKKKLLSIESVRTLLANENWTLLETVYISNTTKMQALCPDDHLVDITVANFKVGRRCKQCHINRTSGKNHYNWIEDRTKIDVTERLRIKKSRNWILKNLQEDVNYNDYKLNSTYQLDHIIPIFAFRDYMIEYKIDEDYIKILANNKMNLQLLSPQENIDKRQADYKIPLEVHFENIKKLESAIGSTPP